MDPRETKETWRNTSLGLKWYKCFDTQNRETTKVVKGGGIFTLSVLERQMNQEAAIPQLDLFRNGTFVLKRAAEGTDPDEIASPNSLTDAEIEEIYNQVTHGEENLANYLASIESSVTLQRMLEIFVAEGDSKEADVKAIRNRMGEVNPSTVRSDRQIITRPEPEDQPTRVSPGGFSVPAGVKVGNG